MYTELKDLMIEASKEAGKVLKDYFEKRKFSVTKKSMNADFVTDADKKAQETIITLLSKGFPEIPIVAEEKENTIQETAFYIDPLDGTLNFIHGFPMFAVSIGYWENGESKIGVVYNPVYEETYWAIQGRGAYLNEEKIRVSSTSSLEESILATGWPYDRSELPIVIKNVENALKKAQEVRSLGSAALECCYVARGSFDGYWERGLSSWDLAGGVVILKEAGAMISGIGGVPFSLERGDIICAAPSIYKEFVSIIDPGELL